MEPIRWSELQREKKLEQRNAKIKEITKMVLFIIALLLAFVIGGMTFPY